MSGSNNATDFGCPEAREAIQVALDADMMEAGKRQLLEAHLAGCADCREHETEMRTIQHALRSLPSPELPDAALQEVWDRTTRAEKTPTQRAWGPGWRNLAAAAAAVLIIAVGGVLQWGGRVPGEPTDEELRRAADEARVVLGLTSQALRKTEQAAFRDVLADEISGALRRVPIEWPEPSSDR